MGYIVYVNWLVGVMSSLGGFGLAATTQKYMAEFLGKGDCGTARYIYFRTGTLQIAMASAVTGGIVFWVLRMAPSEYRAASLLIGLSMWPAVVNTISAQANVAREEMGANLPASVVSMALYFLGIMGTVYFRWGVTGVGIATFAMRVADFLIRLVPTLGRILALERTQVVPAGLRRRMLTFAGQSVAILAVSLIVWQRSEVFLLKNLCSDIRQVAFYSIAFSMADRLLLPSTIFCSAVGATIYAQYGRDKSRIPEIASFTMRYLALMPFPCTPYSPLSAFQPCFYFTVINTKGAAAVVTLAPILCMAKAFMSPAQDLLQSHERQSYVIVTTILAGAIDIGVAWWLIQSHGAVGACIGSGVAQFTAAAILWVLAIRLYKVKLPFRLIGKVNSASWLRWPHILLLLKSRHFGACCAGLQLPSHRSFFCYIRCESWNRKIVKGSIS